MPELRFVRSARENAERAAIVADRTYNYSELLSRAGAVASALLDGAASLENARVAYLIFPGFDHVATQWGVWLAGGVAVPLALTHPTGELQHVIADASPSVIVSSRDLVARIPVEPDGPNRILLIEEIGAVKDPVYHANDFTDALIIYTSGTTGRAKGVVTTHANLDAQVASLHQAWEWSNGDHILLVLPLHHVHGVVNVVCCSLWAGACCEIAAGFDCRATWERFASGDITLFMAVPTIYRKLINEWDRADPETRRRWSRGAAAMRLMVSGSAALPVSTFVRWREITHQTLLERYGMTEIGMALGNPLHGERRPGTVGQSLPFVQVKLRDPVTASELLVCGPTVFHSYWNRPEETVSAFEDGWFKTGDTAVLEDGYYRILGRTSVDIIKSGGFKISALEIEEVYRTHAAIEECAVVGVPDDEWGERVCIAVECVADAELGLSELQEFARDRLAPYKIPREIVCIRALPRNALGKVTKPEVAKLFVGGTAT